MVFTNYLGSPVVNGVIELYAVVSEEGKELGAIPLKIVHNTL